MAPPKFVEAPIILEVNKDENVSMVLPPYTNIARFTSIPINNARRLLDEPILQNALKHVASKTLPQSMDSWRHNLNDGDVVNTFKVKIQKRFPLSFVVRHWQNPDDIAAHFRREYSGNGYDFEPHDQGIMVNAEKLNNMCVAGVRAVTSNDPNSDESKRFRTFIFTMTKTYVHELAHVFVTFLGQGKIHTPPDVGAKKNFEPVMGEPEAGRYVEKAVFGGLISPMRDPAEDDSQAGVLHLDIGNRVFEIKQEAIDDFVNHKFKLPITNLRLPRDQHTKSLGADHAAPEDDTRDPWDDPKTKQLLEEFKAIKWDDVKAVLEKHNPQELTKDMESDLMQASLKPEVLIKGSA